MKKRNGKQATDVGQDDILPEYDFSRGKRNKYAKRYREGSNVVLLDPDVAELFPDSAAVNEALRALGRVSRGRARRSRKPHA